MDGSTSLEINVVNAAKKTAEAVDDVEKEKADKLEEFMELYEERIEGNKEWIERTIYEEKAATEEYKMKTEEARALEKRATTMTAKREAAKSRWRRRRRRKRREGRQNICRRRWHQPAVPIG